ncbi:hypothetical protein Aduo_018916 [Ancylostoma duodenale]
MQLKEISKYLGSLGGAMERRSPADIRVVEVTTDQIGKRANGQITGSVYQLSSVDPDYSQRSARENQVKTSL